MFGVLLCVLFANAYVVDKQGFRPPYVEQEVIYDKLLVYHVSGPAPCSYTNESGLYSFPNHPDSRFWNVTTVVFWCSEKTPVCDGKGCSSEPTIWSNETIASIVFITIMVCVLVFICWLQCQSEAI